MIWEPFVLALVLGLIISAGLYFAYLWPSYEPRSGEVQDDPSERAALDPEEPAEPGDGAATGEPPSSGEAASPSP